MAMQDRGERHHLHKRTEQNEERGEAKKEANTLDEGLNAVQQRGGAGEENELGTVEGGAGGPANGAPAAEEEGAAKNEVPDGGEGVGKAQEEAPVEEDYADEAFEEEGESASKQGGKGQGQAQDSRAGSHEKGGGEFSETGGKARQAGEANKQGEKAKTGPVPPLKMSSPYHLRFNRQPGGSLTERAIVPRGFYQPPIPGEGSQSARTPSGSLSKKAHKSSKAASPAKQEGSFERKQGGVLSVGSTSFEKLNQKSEEKHYMERLFGPKGPLLTYGCKQRYIALPGARPEGVLKMPFGRYFEKLEPFEVRAEESDASVSSSKHESALEDVEYKVSLLNFEQHPGARINSPLSVKAMETLGSITEDLGDKTLEEMTAEAGGDEEMGHLRHEYFSKARSTLISTLREQRLKLERAQQGLGPRELGQIQENQVKKPGMNALTAKMIEKGKLNREKVEIMERRRMEALLKSHIAAKDRVKDLQERLEDKFDAKEKLVGEMRAKLKEHNQIKLQQYEEKHRQLMRKLEEDSAQKLKALKDKAEQAEMNCARATHRVVRKLQEKTELHKMRNERHHLKMVMASRVIETGLRKKVKKQLDGDEMLEKRREYRDSIIAERDEMYRKLMLDRKLFGEVVEDFRKTGKFPKMATEIDLINQFLQLDPDAVPHDFTDKNPQAMLLQRNQIVHTVVKKGDYMFFKFVHNTMDRVRIILKATEGDPDLYVGNHLCPYPNHLEYVWKREDHGDDKMVLHGFERHFVVGFMYIGVRGTSRTVFSICVKWREDTGGVSQTTSEIPVVPGGSHGDISSQEAQQFHTSAPAELGGAVMQGGDSGSADKSDKGSERGEGGHKTERRVSIGEEPALRTQSPEGGSDGLYVQSEAVGVAGADVKRAVAKQEQGLGKRKVTHGTVSIRVASQPEDDVAEEEHTKLPEDRDAWLRKLTYNKVCEWLAALGVNENAIQKVREDRVPGSQIMHMDVKELMEELAMTKLQAVRVFKRDRELMPMPTGHGIDMDELLDWEDDEPPPLPPPPVVEEVVEKPEPKIKSLDKMNFLL